MMKVSCGWEESEQEGKEEKQSSHGRGGQAGWVSSLGYCRGGISQPNTCPTETCSPTALVGHCSVSSLV